MNEPTDVNPHYLDRVIDATRHHTVEASEDIVAGNGMKLLAKGAQVDARVRECLLEHKLSKPLESSLTVSDGFSADKLLEAGRAMLDQHSLLRCIYVGRGGVAPLNALRDLRLGMHEQTALTLYASQRPDKMGHLAAVALLNLSLHRRLDMNASRAVASALTAALFHDVGEVYIDPQVVLATEAPRFEQWKQICVHPVLSHKLMLRLANPDADAAQAVLEHHERLDGFGYPAGMHAAALGAAGRVLAVSEVVAECLNEAAPFSSAAVVLKLIPTEFDRRVVNAVLACGARLRDEAALAQSPPLAESLDALDAIATAIQGYEQRRCRLVNQLETAPAVFREARERYERILAAFASTGLSVQPLDLAARLSDEVPADVRLELALVLREVERRFAELRRQLKLRVAQFSPAHAQLAREVLKTSAPMPLD